MASSDEYQTEKVKTSMLVKVERRFVTIKHQFGYSKMRYRCLDKNTNRFYLLADFSNLL